MQDARSPRNVCRDVSARFELGPNGQHDDRTYTLLQAFASRVRPNGIDSFPSERVSACASPSKKSMAQVKKEEGRNAILRAAAELFSQKGYHNATLREISALAGMSLSNVYVYFRSKYDILFAVNDPWVRSWFELLEQDAMLISDQRMRLEHIIRTVWRDVPAAHNGFARNIMQALSETAEARQYDPTMLRWLEAKLNQLMISCMPEEKKALFANGQIAHVIMMAFDGFALNATVNPAAACNELTVRAICGLLLPAPQDSKSAKSKSTAKRLRPVAALQEREKRGATRNGSLGR